jgi:hypothetical protein
VASANVTKPEAKRASHHRSRPGSDRDRGGGAGGDHAPWIPLLPSEPSFVLAGVSGAAGGVLFALWCAILIEAVAWGAQRYRRHRPALVLIAPTGVVSVQQRPG